MSERALHYVALGDSSSAGTADDVPGERWPDIVAERLREEVGPVEYWNLAVYGVKSTEVAATQVDGALTRRPDLVTLVCGINDVLMSASPPIDAYRATLAGMVARFQAELPGVTIVTATIPDLSRFVPYRPLSRARVSAGFDRLAEATRGVAAQYEIACVDLAAHPELHVRESYGPDGYHPSPHGHQRMAGAFLDTILRAAPRPVTTATGPL